MTLEGRTLAGRPRRVSLPAVASSEAERWSTLLPLMRACERCTLSRTRHQVVVYRGAERPPFLFIGEAPGKQEDAQGLPFVGRAGRLLDEATRAAGLSEEEWGVTNTIMCRPPRNRFDREAAAACRPWLSQKVAALAPRVLITLGANALAAFLPEELPVLKAAGRSFRWNGLVLYAMLHPAATLHSRKFAERWHADWAAFAGLLPGLRASTLAGTDARDPPPRSAGGGIASGPAVRT